MSPPPIRVGDVIANKYEVESVVGEGGMGIVVAARHLELQQRVAIKYLLPEIAEQGLAAERFRREARSAARIRGEHVCRVLDVGTLDSGVPFMVMEYLEGRDLAGELASRTRLPASEAVEYVLQACEALAEAHAAGIVHRDLKPANLFLAARSDGSRRIKVLDFGVSKSLLGADSSQLSLTQTASFVGSPLYMSPEQLDSAKSVDARTDIWAMGIVLYELLTGRAPFLADSIPRLLSAVLNDPPPPFATLSVKAPSGLEAVVRRALAKSRDERYASVAELANALTPFAPDHAAPSATRVARLLSNAPPSLAPPERVRDGEAPADAKRPRTPPESAVSSTPLSWPRGSGPEHVRMRPRSKRWAMTALLLVLVTAGVLVYELTAVAPASEPSAQPEPAATPPVGAPAKSAAAAAAQVPEPAEPRPEAPQIPPQLPVGRSGPVGVGTVAPDRGEPAGQQPPSSPTVSGTQRARPDKEPAQRRPREHGASESARPAAPGSGSGLPDFGGRR